MTNLRFDHFVTYTSAATIDDYLKEYAAQGFIPHEKTVRHVPGLRNGFILIGPEYIEFCWVEDETLFSTADAEEKVLRTTPRPFGLGIVADDVQAIHDDWTARGYSVPEVSWGRPHDASPDTPPAWIFQDIPSAVLPGVSCFVLTYHAKARDEVCLVKTAPNTIYAVSGVTFVTTEPEARASCWRNLLAPGEDVSRSGTGFDVWIGPHLAMWRTPEVFQATYGLRWTPHPLSIGELALLHLLASDVQAVQTMMEQSGRRTFAVSVRGEEGLLVAPDARDGFAFIIWQQPVEMWLRERIGRTGERLKLAQD